MIQTIMLTAGLTLCYLLHDFQALNYLMVLSNDLNESLQLLGPGSFKLVSFDGMALLVSAVLQSRPHIQYLINIKWAPCC